MASRKILLLLQLGVVSVMFSVVHGTDKEPEERSPPQANPNVQQTRPGIETKSFDPVPSLDSDWHHPSAGSCDEKKLKSVADAFAESASKYDPSDPSKTPNIGDNVVQLRKCIFSVFHHKHEKLNEEVRSKIRTGVESFLKNPKFETENDDHYRIAHNVIRLIVNTHDFLNYVEQLSKLLANVKDKWKFPSQEKYSKIDQSDVVNDMFFVFFKSHKNVTAATEFYCKHQEIPKIFDDFMTQHADLVNTSNEYILRNAGGELARFLKYKCLNEQVDGFVEKQLKQYNATSAHKVWFTMVVVANHYGSKKYGGKKFRLNTNMEKQIMTFRKDCGKTYKDTFIIKAQSTMTDREATEICGKLKSHESYFHGLVKDNWQPVAEDNNDKLEVVIFNNVKDYKYYGSLIYSIDTNNGGYYLEGTPNWPGNQARYFCHKLEQNGKQIIWNLEHEFTHYLDGRYNMKGSTRDTMGGRRIWWLEGFPEYAAYKQNHPKKVQLCQSNRYQLSYIFGTTYSSGTSLVYDYSYLAARFMFEKHRNDVDTILKYFRAGQYSQFESWFNGIYKRYDSEFSTWCSCIASRRCQ